jgi:hypothetical protein
MSSIDDAIKAAEREAEAANLRSVAIRVPPSDVIPDQEASLDGLLPSDHKDSSSCGMDMVDASGEQPVFVRRHTLNTMTIQTTHPTKEIPPFHVGSWRMFTASKINLMLVFLPIGIAAELLEWSDGAIFGLNCMAILPLAKLLGDATEQVAVHTNDTIGGLLNATFGNATELIVSLFALYKVYY